MTMKQKDGKSIEAKGKIVSNQGRNHTALNDVKKPKRRNKCDLGPNFVAPDGGWGWLVVIAAGCSNVSCGKQMIIRHLRFS